MSDTGDKYEQMLVKALQLALEEDQEERDQKQKQIESRKKLVPKSRRSMPGESDMIIPEKQEINKSNEEQAEEYPNDAKEERETQESRDASGGVEINEDTSGKNDNLNDETHNDENMTEGDENQDQSPYTATNDPTQRPIFITPFAVPAENLQTRNLLWTAKTEITDVPGGVLPEQKGRNTNIPVLAKEKEEDAEPKLDQESNPQDRPPLKEEHLWAEMDEAQ